MVEAVIVPDGFVQNVTQFFEIQMACDILLAGFYGWEYLIPGIVVFVGAGEVVKAKAGHGAAVDFYMKIYTPDGCDFCWNGCPFDTIRPRHVCKHISGVSFWKNAYVFSGPDEEGGRHSTASLLLFSDASGVW